MSDMNNDDDLFEGFEEEAPAEEPREPRQKKSNNRTFIAVIGLIAVVFVLAIIGIIVAATVILPRQNAARLQQAAEINAQNTMTAMAATDQSFAMAQTLLAPTNTPRPQATAQPSPTAVVVFATDTPVPSETPQTDGTGEAAALAVGGAAAKDLQSRTQTVAALLTQAAQGLPTQAAGAAGTITALPTTGFADEVGLPGMLGAAVLLVAVIFAARRLRSAGS